MRLLRSGLSRKEIQPKLRALVDRLFTNIPSGVGSNRSDLKLTHDEVVDVMRRGAGWAVSRGYGEAEDLRHIESGGRLDGARPEEVSDRAVSRGRPQLGTLGSGNHFAEIQFVDEIFDDARAAAFGLFAGQVTVSIHSGSRGLGYQVCDDFLDEMLASSRRYGIKLPDRQLCCAPVRSPEGERYLGAMAAAANYAFANRQMMTHWVRETFQRVLRRSPSDLALEIVYDVCHNIAKIERHEVDGRERELCVHRKGATRAFPPGHPETPEAYREAGQPVLIPGDMGRYSYVLAGTSRAFGETWGSTCHGAGRRLSRAAAKRSARGRDVEKELEERGILIRASGRRTILEEIPRAYKDVADVVDVVDGAGIARKVARLVPMGVIKG